MLTLLKLAAKISAPDKDTYRKAYVGAIGVRQDGVIVSSRNGSTPYPDARSPSCHAEARLLRQTGFGAVIYVARVKRDGSFGLAKPCFTCTSYLKSKRVKTVYYTISNNEWGVLKL